VSSPGITASLAAWMPRLIAAYRKARKTSGPADRLTPQELDSVARGVRHLSEGLTRGRRLVSAGYMDDPALLGAYLLYFWPVSYVQARIVLDAPGARPRSALDLAAGPGPMAMAALDAGASDVMALDRSTKALELAGVLAGLVGNGVSTRAWNPQAGDALPGGGLAWSLVTMGHGLNELWADEPDRIDRRAALLTGIAGRLRKGGSLVVIEPALRTTTRELLAVRDRLVAGGLAVRAPCLFRGPCPALQREVDWCHAEKPWTPPPALAEIIGAAGLHKEALKMAYLVVAPPGESWAEPPPGRVLRVVSERFAGHGRERLIGCGPEGRVPVARSEALRSADNAGFDGLVRGDLFALDGAEPAMEGDGLRVVAATRVRRLEGVRER
jgi:hypothetical protein